MSSVGLGSPPAQPRTPPGPVHGGGGRDPIGSWPLLDRACYALCWITGIGLCLIAAAIVVFMMVKGVAYLKPSLFFESPAPEALQSKSGGFLDPIIGTLIVAVLGILIALPLGVAIAV